jgi:hypothetical protein
MQSLMETGQALYVLAGICALGIITRMLTRNLYKRLIKESANLAAAKNKGLKELRQRAENAYHVNQGMRDTGSWLEHQLGELHFRGMTLAGWTNLASQLTWLCLLAGGAGAFYAYWFRMDTYYIVMYGGGAVLMAMLTMLFDGSIASTRRDQLISVLQDYLENTMFPRMGRISERTSRLDSLVSPAAADDENYAENDRPLTDRTLSRRTPFHRKRQEAPMETAAAAVADPVSVNTSPPAGDNLKRSLEQIAASRERNRQGPPSAQMQSKMTTPTAENFLKELSPNELQVINDILANYLAGMSKN